MTDTQNQQRDPFLLGVTYWPRRKAFTWWSDFDRGETRDELAHITALGCTSVRVCLRWEDVQPGPERLNTETLRELERVLDMAADARLRVIVALFPVALGGALHMPRWVNHPDPLDELQQALRFGPPLVLSAAQAPVIYENGYRRNEAQDLFRDAAIRSAQAYLVREVIGYFGAHPAAWAWQLGDGLERVCKPDSAAAVRAWHAALADVARAAYNQARLIGITSAHGLRTSAGPRPEHLAAACDLVGVSASPPLQLGQRPLNSDAIAFLHALTSGLAEQAALLTDLGLPTSTPETVDWVADSAYGQELATYLADEEQQALFISEALGRLHRAGAPGVWLAAYADYPAALWRRPPLDRSVRERTLGLVASDGREKAVARVVSDFAARIRSDDQGQQQSASLNLDPERYWRDPRREYERLWGEWEE